MTVWHSALRLSSFCYLWRNQHKDLIAGGRGGTGSFGHVPLFSFLESVIGHIFWTHVTSLRKLFFYDTPEDVLMCCWSRTPITAIDNSTATNLNSQCEMHTHWSIFGITKAVSWKEQNKWGNFVMCCCEQHMASFMIWFQIWELQDHTWQFQRLEEEHEEHHPWG
jgi:hypothetical protein